MHGVGVLGGMAGSIGLWWVGAFFTLRWIESLGLGVSTNSTVLWWLLPLTITAMEVGLQPGNIKRSATSLIWGLVLLFDAYTTATGLHWWTKEQIGIAMPQLEYWTLAILIGVLLALAPERIVRLLWNELR